MDQQESEHPQNSSYKQIAKSSTIVGGTQVLKILIGVARVKALAIILGPAGVGIAGIYQTIIDLVTQLTSFGISFSGVKTIAEADSSGDSKRISTTILILRRWALATGLLGMLVTIVLSGLFSHYSFGNTNYVWSICFLSVILLIASISSVQITLLQGLRKIPEMAKATLMGTLLGTTISIPFYIWLKESGIVLAMIINAAIALLISWMYARKIKIGLTTLSFRETYTGGLDMAKLGFFIVVNGFIAALSMYITRSFILVKLDTLAVGYFQAVSLVSTTYVNILLLGMLADFFPRLSQIHTDSKAANQLINQQLEMTLLIGGPMLILMIVFSPLLILILYSEEFINAVPLLRWQIASAFITFISWPMGVLYLSKNQGIMSVFSEFSRQGSYLLMVYFAWNWYGFESLGIGLFFANFINVFYVFWTVKKLSGYALSKNSLNYAIIFGTALLAVLFLSLFMKESLLYYTLLSILIVPIIVFSYQRINQMIGLKEMIKKKLFGRN